MTDLLNRTTGDTTYRDRVARYEYVVQRRSETPRPTLQQIADELGIAKQNVSRLLARGTVRPAGRPPTNDGRIKRLEARLATWQKRLHERQLAGKPTDREQEWISKLTSEMESLR